jgi:EmrB/QacA subfamily drug resistance transporter
LNYRSAGYKWWVLAVVSIANLSASLDMSIITISFPRLTHVFQVDASMVVWLTVAFSVAELGLLLTMARIGDSIGRKRIFTIGLAIYTVGLVLCSLSPNILVLIFSRVVQGAGAAVMMTLGSAIVVGTFPKEQQGQAIGMLAMFVSVGLIAGPALGGVILDYLDWQGIFYTRIPVGIIALVLTAIIIQEHREANSRLQLDIGGAVTLLIGATCLLLFLNLGRDWGYLAAPSLVLLTSAIVLLGIFLYVERHVSQPVLDLSFFKNRVFTLASVTNMLQMMSCSIAPVLIPFFLVSGLQLSSSASGLLMALIAVPPVIISPVSGWISDRIGNRIPMIIACCFFTAALFIASRWSIQSTIPQVILVLVCFGIGMGTFNAPNQSAIISSAPRRNMATALGIANTVRMLGASIGTAVAGTLYAHQAEVYSLELTARGTAADLVERLSVIQSFQNVILLGAFVSVTTIITSVLIGRSPAAEEKSAVADKTS